MKKIGKNKYSFDDVLKAYVDCCKNKGTKPGALEYKAVNTQERLFELCNSINNGTYKIGSSTIFTISEPKPREIWAAQYEDRIVQHLLYNDLYEHYNKIFISDTFSCIPKRGCDNAIKRVHDFAISCSENYAFPTFALKMDVENYFVTINKNILWDILLEQVDENTLTGKLLKDNVFYDSTINPIIKPNTNLDIIPYKKSLFHTDGLHGLPIGNLLSQFYSNVYLDKADKFAKHTLKLKYYARYVDDILVLDRDKEKLQEISEKYNDYLKSKLSINLQETKTKIYNINGGIHFLGKIIYKDHIYVNKKIVKKLKDSVYKLSRDPYNKDYMVTVQSYLGLMVNYNTYNIRKKICEPLKNNPIFLVSENYDKINYALI